MHTEEEAKTKWCPMIRADNVTPLWHGKTQEPGYTPQAKATCIASACMAWRWDDASFEAAMERYEDSFNIGGIDSREQPVRRGYCGLAGKVPA